LDPPNGSKPPTPGFELPPSLLPMLETPPHAASKLEVNHTAQPKIDDFIESSSF
jgi:hypothetical protein